MSEAYELMAKYIFWSLGAGFGVMMGTLAAVWVELRGLRKVRHEDREAITRTSADVDIALHDYKNVVDDYKTLVETTVESNEELKRENGILKYMLKQAGQNTEGLIK